MLEARRRFLWCAGALISGTVLELQTAAEDQRKRKFPTPPQGADRLPDAQAADTRRTTDGAVVQEHEKAFRDCLNALFGRVDQLNRDVEKLHSANIFSVSVYKQATEIEKLAKQLKNLAKG